MFFKSETVTKNNEVEMQWKITEVYDKPGKDAKLLRTEKILQFRRNWDAPWADVWNSYNAPIYLNKED